MKRIAEFLLAAVTENGWLKLLALLISIGLFLSVRMQEKIERWVDVEVELLMPEEIEELVMVNPPLHMVRVRIRGRHSLVNTIREESSHVVKMDLRDRRQPGVSTHFFEPEMFRFEGVEIIDVSPDAISIRFERVLSRRLSVVPKLVGGLQAGTELKSAPQVVPDWVDVIGASSAVRTVATVFTEDVVIDNLPVGAHVEEVSLMSMDGIRYSRDMVTIRFDVVEQEIEREIPSVPVVSDVDENRNLRIVPETVTLHLQGPVRILDHLDVQTLKPLVQLDVDEHRRPGVYAIPVTLKTLPDAVRILRIEPAAVDVRVLN